MRQRLSSVERPAPELDWDKLFRAADEQRAARRRKTVVLWRSVAVAAALAGVLVGGVVYLSRNNNEQQIASSTTEKQGKHKQEVRQQTSGANNDNPISDNDYMEPQQSTSSPIERLVAAVTSFAKSALPGRTASDALVAQAEEPVVTMQLQSASAATECPMTSETTPVGLSAPTTNEQAQGQGSVVKKEQPRQAYTQTHPHAAAGTRQSRQSDVTAKTYVSGALGNTSNTSAMSFVSSSMSDAMYDPDAETSNDYTAWNTASAMDRKVKHHQPLRLGLSVRYQLNSRWSIDAGVSYSHHTSDITETSGDYARYTDHDLTFVGVPVNANYSIWSNRYINIYGSAGGEVERMVKGKATTRTTYTGQTDEVTEDKVKMTRPVFSVNAAVGVEAKLGQTVSIYAEPGVGYHFKNGSQLETIYNDKPFNASLNLGVRFSLK